MAYSDQSTGSLAAESTLPRGRHNLSETDVLHSQRRRMVRAMLDCVYEDGLAATTVADVVRTAKVSRTAFYRSFADKEACFLEACDQACREMLEEISDNAGTASWIDSVEVSTRRYLNWWQSHPQYAVAYLVELPAAGARALEQRDRVYNQFVQIMGHVGARARSEQPELPALRPLTLRMIVAAVTEIVAQETRAGRLGQLVELAEDLVYLIVKMLSDEATADRCGSGSRREQVAGR